MCWWADYSIGHFRMNYVNYNALFTTITVYRPIVGNKSPSKEAGLVNLLIMEYHSIPSPPPRR